jgi:hypothetical protein
MILGSKGILQTEYPGEIIYLDSRGWVAVSLPDISEAQRPTGSQGGNQSRFIPQGIFSTMLQIGINQ